MEQVPDLDALFIAVGGGGMIGCISKYISEANPKIKGTQNWAVAKISIICKFSCFSKNDNMIFLVFCVEPEGKEIQKSFEAGKRLWESGALLNTIADGLRVLRVGDKCFPVLQECCQKRVFSVVR